MFPRPATPLAEIEGAGGAYVRRRFTFGAREMLAGDRLTSEEVASIPIANLHSMININLIELYPAPPPVPPTVGEGDYFLMPADDTGRKFHVIQGRQVTKEPLSRAAAQAKMKELAP